ncbi:MAG: NAD/NADP octopine/nopaline dehydrogenase family protein [Burkholderiales bacterium]|nr:NAD/NADP octopine/nopaline dehydrogenase family protein [Burkholderiales bacterium]
MRVAMVGAGGIARAYAVLAVRAGHEAALWSPTGRGTADLHQATLDCAGAIEGRYPVSVLSEASALGDADLVIVALPATAYAAVIPQAARHLRSGQTVFVSGALSLAPLWLAELATAAGQSPLVCAAGTTVATARRRDGGVALMTVRTRLAIAALPASRANDALATLRAIFGDRFDLAPSVLAVTLANINPVAHAAMALTNFTRIERAEAWPQYHYLTPAVARVVEAMDGERRAIATAFDLSVTTIEQHFQRSFDVPQATLADIAAELHRRRGGPPGPTTTDTRFVREDVPFGLVFNAALARIVGVPAPVTEAAITLHCALYGEDFRAANPLIGALGLEGATRESLLARVDRA